MSDSIALYYSLSSITSLEICDTSLYTVLQTAPISASSIAKLETSRVATTVSAEAAAAVTAAALLLELLIAAQTQSTATSNVHCSSKTTALCTASCIEVTLLHNSSAHVSNSGTAHEKSLSAHSRCSAVACASHQTVCIMLHMTTVQAATTAEVDAYRSTVLDRQLQRN
eukprot:7397-Heterococcus_DN1.PRE.1